MKLLGVKSGTAVLALFITAMLALGGCGGSGAGGATATVTGPTVATNCHEDKHNRVVDEKIDETPTNQSGGNSNSQNSPPTTGNNGGTTITTTVNCGPQNSNNTTGQPVTTP
jgi:hypothetical protein